MLHDPGCMPPFTTGLEPPQLLFFFSFLRSTHASNEAEPKNQQDSEETPTPFGSSHVRENDEGNRSLQGEFKTNQTTGVARKSNRDATITNPHGTPRVYAVNCPPRERRERDDDDDDDGSLGIPDLGTGPQLVERVARGRSGSGGRRAGAGRQLEI
jgi:hypothetical protein